MKTMHIEKKDQNNARFWMEDVVTWFKNLVKSLLLLFSDHLDSDPKI